jgi:cell division protein FtsZ
MKRVPDLPVEQAFAVMDHIVGETIRGLADAVNQKSLIQLDFPDLREILRSGGVSTILFGEGDVYRPETVLESALNNALLEVDYRTSGGAILQMTTGTGVPLRSVDHVVEGIRKRIRRDARVAFGVRTDPEFEGAMRVMSVITGVQERLTSPAKARADPDVPVVR